MEAASDNYDILINWKLLLSKTALQLQQAKLESPSLERILSKRSLEDICFDYFSYVVHLAAKHLDFQSKPQFVIGTPASSETSSAAARQRYMQHIEAAFLKLAYPKPRFFPEPFAVFQYHWNKGDISDVGRHQNIFILDIGGGTTNACFVQSSAHGRLARGGANHLPRGVRTIEIGGANVDHLLLTRVVKSTRLRETSRSLIAARTAKEEISTLLNQSQSWLD